MAHAHHILVVVDPTAASQPALGRAAHVAARMGWTLELLVCLHEGVPRGAADPKAVRRALLSHQLGFLKELARGYPGLTCVTRAVWDRPLHEAIIRETLRSEPRLVMKDAHFHSALSRALFTNADWHLIRDCPAPLWLVHGAPWASKPTVVAFVDPMHEHEKAANLDHRILREASFLASGLGGDVRAVHCFEDTALAATLGAAAIPGVGGALANVPADLEPVHVAALNRLAAAEGIAQAQVQLRSGLAASEIPAAARAAQADLAVMGAVSRSRLQQAFLGSTAERALERLHCDLLVIKPARFESPVTYRAQPADFMEVH